MLTYVITDGLTVAYKDGAMVASTEWELVSHRATGPQQDRNLHDIVDMATDLLASLDPDALNPEQFIAWCALAYRVGYAEAGLSP